MQMHSTTTTTFFIIVVSVAISTCYSQDDEKYTPCARNFSCGTNIQNVGYPFWGNGRLQDCGHPSFELQCIYNEYPTIKIDNRDFRVLDIDQPSYTITIASLDLWKTHCTQELHNITLDHSLLRPGPMNRDLFIFYNCTSEVTPLFPNDFRNNFTCETAGTVIRGFYAEESLYKGLENSELTTISCTQSIEVPVLLATMEEISGRSLSLQEGLRRGFDVVYYAYYTVNCSSCEGSGGICGSNSSGFVCHCSDGTEHMTCQKHAGNKPNIPRKLAIGFGASIGTVLVMCVIFFLRQRWYKKRYGTSPWTSQNIFSRPSSTTDLERSGAFYGVHIFKYSELEKATGNFDPKKELGDGGFGAVYQGNTGDNISCLYKGTDYLYAPFDNFASCIGKLAQNACKGKLKDGRVVAVKRLYEHNYKRMEQFMNEVEILARLRHQNLVSLYGCTSRHCRELLLVYEYVPNGTVADHLHGDRAKPGSLSWTTRMSIAVETATALAYLHASDVIHRDVKTNNILLDSNFCVKVADFGLSRLFPNNVSHVSTAPQGTPGYVDPEYHECYQLTVKSDVYSFAVVLIELISSQPAVDITRHRHEINLSTMAVNKIQNHALHELVDPFLGFETDFKVREMISEVAELAFQCLQNDKDMRPSMETVLETLKGIQSEDGKLRKAEEVEIPCDEVVLLRCDRSTLSPDSTVEISSGITPHGSS